MGQIASPGDRFRFAHMHIGDDLDLLILQYLAAAPLVKIRSFLLPSEK